MVCMANRRCCFFRAVVICLLFLCIANWSIQINVFSQSNQLVGITPEVSFTGCYQKNQLYFTENKGQWPPEIQFIGETLFGQIAFTESAIYYIIIPETSSFENEDENLLDLMLPPHHPKENKETPNISSLNTIKLSFVDSNLPKVMGKSQLPHFNNYFFGNDPRFWGVECRNFTQVYLTDVWEGIDLAYFFTPCGLKYEFYVDPMASISQIRVKVDGADIASDSKGIVFKTKLGEIYDSNLSVFLQDSKVPISAKMNFNDSLITFSCNINERDEVLVIDPVVYSSFLGGTNEDYSNAIATDSDGNAYITGYTRSTNFLLESSSDGEFVAGYSKNNSGNRDAFVLKLNPNGDRLIYATYIGGSKFDSAWDITLDSSGNAYIAGYTASNDFPIVSGAYDEIHSGSYDSFIIKLNREGSELVCSTFFGGHGIDAAYSIALDSFDNVFVAGLTSSGDCFSSETNQDQSWKSYQDFHKGGFFDAFIVKLNTDGSRMIYASYLGGNDYDYAWSIAVDTDGSCYIVGHSSSSDFPMNQFFGGPPSPGLVKTHSGYYDGFLVKLSPSGTQLLYATFIGGSDSDWAVSIDLDSSRNVYIAGYTYSNNFLKLNPKMSSIEGYNKSYNNNQDAFVVKISPNGTELLYSTYLGGSESDWATSVVADSKGNAYVTGHTDSIDFPMTKTPGGMIAPGYEKNHLGNTCGFALKLSIPQDVAIVLPILHVSAETNREVYFKDDQVMISILVVNASVTSATNTIVKLTIPKELEYVRTSRFKAQKRSEEIIDFELLTIPSNSAVQFQVDLKVKSASTHLKSLHIFFDVQCKEKAQDFYNVIITIDPNRTNPPDLYLGMYFKNLKWDPQDSSFYLEQNTLADIDFNISGALAPLDCRIDWGDGKIDNYEGIKTQNFSLEHIYSSVGMLKIEVRITDTLNRVIGGKAIIKIK